MEWYLVESLVIAFGLVFLMEIGDKTQLTSFTLTIKYKNRKKVFLGVSLGLVTVTLIGVMIGLLVKRTIEFSYLKPLTALLFFVFGCFILILLFRNKSSSEKEDILCPVSLEKCSTAFEDRKNICTDVYNCKTFIDNVTSKGAVYKSFSLIFLAELGDKTMLTAIALTSTPHMVALGVFVGGSLALMIVNGIGIFFGHTIMKTSFKDYLEPVSGGLFIVLAFIIILI